jgi:hypothetical protein
MRLYYLLTMIIIDMAVVVSPASVTGMRCGTTYYKPAMVGDKVVFVVSQP